LAFGEIAAHGAVGLPLEHSLEEHALRRVVPEQADDGHVPAIGHPLFHHRLERRNRHTLEAHQRHDGQTNRQRRESKRPGFPVCPSERRRAIGDARTHTPGKAGGDRINGVGAQQVADRHVIFEDGPAPVAVLDVTENVGVFRRSFRRPRHPAARVVTRHVHCSPVLVTRVVRRP
jgi:hypothetical protein